MSGFPGQDIHADKRQGEASIHLGGLEENIDRLQLKLNNLVMSLQPVLGPDRPRPANPEDDRNRPVENSPFASRLQRQILNVQNMIDLIDYTNDRLEL